MRKLFTSESVCEGHPDKICDIISDAILDEALRQDPLSRTAIETVVGANQICIFGEVNTAASIDFEGIARGKVRDLGYTNPAWGFSDQSTFNNFIHQQSPEIAIAVEKEGAGDQGMMFGYACTETPDFMPLPITIAHALTKKIDTVRKEGTLKWLRPDGKAQVTLSYETGHPAVVEKTVIAVAHDEQTTPDQVQKGIKDFVVTPVLNSFGIKGSKDTIINGTGLWHIPGPESDTGLTGRKIVVDSYGGSARVGGGAFSGKDPSKVDRSGAYAARYIAKNIVANGMATHCEVGLAYVIGHPKPLMETIDTFGTQTVEEKTLYEFAHNLIDTSVGGIIEKLNLRQPIYSQTSAYGHFGKPGLPWEKVVT